MILKFRNFANSQQITDVLFEVLFDIFSVKGIMAIIQSFFQSCFKVKFPENKPKLLNSNQVYYQGKITLNRLIQTPSIDDHNFLKWIGLNIKVQILKKMIYLHFAMKCKKIARSPTKGATFAKSYFISRTTFSIVKLCTSRYRM